MPELPELGFDVAGLTAEMVSDVGDMLVQVISLGVVMLVVLVASRWLFSVAKGEERKYWGETSGKDAWKDEGW